MSLDILTVISYDRHDFNLNYGITRKLNDYSHNWIVVENYSKDKHGAFDPDKKITKIEEDNIKYVEGIDQDSLNVRVIKKKNLSYSLNPQRSIFHSKGLSLGLKNSNSKYLLIIDPDFFVIRKNWIKNIIEYMEEKNIDLFSSPYHPVKDWTKPFTPCVYFMILNTEKINKNKLNFNPPEINEILNKKKILKKNLFENNPMFYWVLLIGFLFRDKNRYQIRKLGDVGHNLLNFKEINLYLTQPAISKIKDLKLNRLILDRFLPDEYKLIQKNSNFSFKTFKDFSYYDFRKLGCQEYFWQNMPFAFHLRGSIKPFDNNLDELKKILGKFY